MDGKSDHEVSSFIENDTLRVKLEMRGRIG